MLGIGFLICLQFLHVVAPGLERIKILKYFKSAVLPCCFLFYFGIFAAGEKNHKSIFLLQIICSALTILNVSITSNKHEILNNI